MVWFNPDPNRSQNGCVPILSCWHFVWLHDDVSKINVHDGILNFQWKKLMHNNLKQLKTCIIHFLLPCESKFLKNCKRSTSRLTEVVHTWFKQKEELKAVQLLTGSVWDAYSSFAFSSELHPHVTCFNVTTSMEHFKCSVVADLEFSASSVWIWKTLFPSQTYIPDVLYKNREEQCLKIKVFFFSTRLWTEAFWVSSWHLLDILSLVFENVWVLSSGPTSCFKISLLVFDTWTQQRLSSKRFWRLPKKKSSVLLCAASVRTTRECSSRLCFTTW